MVIIVAIFNESFRFFFKGMAEQAVSDVCFLSPFFPEHCTIRKKIFHEQPEKE